MTDFQTKARELVNSLQKHIRLDCTYDIHISDDAEEDIATALSAAYEQGKRDGAEQERQALSLWVAGLFEKLSAAIRKRGEA